MKLIVATAALLIMISAGESKWSEMVSDAQNILRLLEDMAICQEAELKIVNLINCFENVQVKHAQPDYGKQVQRSINRPTEARTIEEKSTLVNSNNAYNSVVPRLPCRRFMRGSC